MRTAATLHPIAVRFRPAVRWTWYGVAGRAVGRTVYRGFAVVLIVACRGAGFFRRAVAFADAWCAGGGRTTPPASTAWRRWQ